MTPIKFAVVISHPTQHFVPLYKELASYEGIDLKVFYLAENGVQGAHDADFGLDVKWDTPMLEGYEYEFVEPGRVLTDFGFWSVDSPRLNEMLANFNADWLWVHGYAQRANWRAILAKKKYVKSIYTSDSNAWITPHKSAAFYIKQAIKYLGVRLFFKHINIFLAISPANHEYLLRYGVPDKKIVKTSFPIDIQRLHDARQSLQTPPQTQLQKLKDSLNLTEREKIIVTVSKLTMRKRVADIVESLSRLKDSSVHLIVVGSGECSEQLSNQVEQLNLSQRVHLVGFVNQSELPKYLALSDVFVFASENEPYGAVVSEALPFSLPVVIARKIGAIGASAIDGVNALIFNVGDVEDLTQKLDMLLSNHETMQSMSKQSLAMSAQHDKSVMANDIYTVCKQDQEES